MWASHKQPQRQPGLELTTFAHYRMACLAEQGRGTQTDNGNITNAVTNMFGEGAQTITEVLNNKQKNK